MHSFCQDIGSQTKRSFDQPHFSLDSVLESSSTKLPFFQSPHDFKPFDRGKGGFHGFKSERRFYQAFELSVIGLDNIIEIFDLPMFGVMRALAFFFEFINGNAVASRFVRIDLEAVLPLPAGFEIRACARIPY
ncbi:hypothetical protein IB75_07230 [Nitrosococcus oceani C-27]|uniref:Uncharacterized protein n=1 Tax=Nitrosococcus oceani C-27 TaxID=314279 RepID=A0A0E2Z205_9GAMM|nr:hypothetical protein IB75_07230 [Nitrosococcus oceani C-27]GEM19518.1 hypothetical protein NONS58_09080 [Nitrosococcus oceani]